MAEPTETSSGMQESTHATDAWVETVGGLTEHGVVPAQSSVSHTSVAINIPVRYLEAELPPLRYALPGDAGTDLVSRVEVRLGPGERAIIPTGVCLAVPAGYAGFVHPRSGLAARHGITVVNAPGTIDAGYRGEIKVVLLNTDATDAYVVHRGDRIAQLVIQSVAQVRWHSVAELATSERGSAGFGSSGTAGISS